MILQHRSKVNKYWNVLFNVEFALSMPKYETLRKQTIVLYNTTALLAPFLFKG